MLEENAQSLPISARELLLDFKPCEIKTVLVEFGAGEKRE
jgi:hypothetical protein